MEAGNREVTSEGVTGKPTVTTEAKAEPKLPNQTHLVRKQEPEKSWEDSLYIVYSRGILENRYLQEGRSKNPDQVEVWLLAQPAIAASQPILLAQEDCSFTNFLSPLSPSHREALCFFICSLSSEVLQTPLRLCIL